jgi:hypothetical protein
MVRNNLKVGKNMKRALKWLTGLIGLLVLFLVVLYVLLITPPGQTFVTQKIASFAKSNYGIDLSVRAVDISFFDHVILEGVQVNDDQNDTLLYAGSLDVGVWNLSFKKTQNALNIRYFQADSLRFYLSQQEGDTITNLNHLLNKLPQSEPDIKSGKPFTFTAGEIHVTNSQFKYRDFNVPRSDSGIDWSHLNLFKLNLSVIDFSLDGDTVLGDIQNLQLADWSGFEVERFAGNAHFSPKKTEVEDLVIKTPNSDLNFDLLFSYNDLAAYSDFINSVKMTGDFAPSTLNFADIAYFAPTLTGWRDTIRLSGKVRGKVNNLKADDMDIRFGKSSHLLGDINMNGLPDFENTFMMVDLKQLSTNRSDLQTISIPPNRSDQKLQVPAEIGRMGNMQFTGNFTGFVSDFVANGKLKTRLGILETDIKLAQNENEVFTYSGELISKKFDLGRLVDAKQTVGKISLVADVKGKEFDPEKLDAELDGNIQQVEFMGYNYNDILLGGRFTNKMFRGNFSVNDTNLAMEFRGLISMRDTTEIRAEARIIKAYPVRLNWMEKDSSFFVSGAVNANFKGNSIDDVLGKVVVDSVTVAEKEKMATLKQIEFSALTNARGKILRLTTENLNAKVNGQFNFAELPNVLNYMFYEVMPSAYSKQVKRPKEDEQFELTVELSEFSKFSKILVPQVTVLDSLYFGSNFDLNNKQLNFDLKTGFLEISGLDIQPVSATYRQTSNEVNFNLSTQKIAFSDSAWAKNFKIVANAQKDSAIVSVDWNNKQENKNYKGDLNLKGNVVGPKELKVVFENSYFTLADTLWKVPENSFVKIDHDTVVIKDFKFYHESQGLSLDGRISPNPNDSIVLAGDRIDLKLFNLILAPYSVELGGELNGSVSANDLYETPMIYGDLTIDELFINSADLGDASLVSHYRSENKDIKIDAEFEKEGTQLMNLTGFIYPQKSNSAIDLNLSLKSLPVSFTEPFLDEFITDLTGSLSGNVNISGKTSAPKMRGGLTLNDFASKVDYLNTTYTIEKGDFFIHDGIFGADLLKIKDDEERVAQSNISIIHDNFSNFNYDIWITTPEGFKVLNTKEEDNELFYGTANLSPQSSVTLETRSRGNTQLTVNAGTGDNTAIFLPLTGSESVNESDYVTFIDRDSLRVEVNPVKKANIEQGFILDIDLDVSEKAMIQLIFDKSVGDLIEARGEGNISIDIDEYGNFEIFGTYEINKGSYLFTLKDLINKRFTIKPGSFISWNGDPMKGQANITAVYSLRTNLYDLNLPVTADTNELKRRVPVDLLLNMTGDYTNPDLTFDFDLPERYADIESILSNMETGDKNKQVFSLLILNKFVAYGSAGPGGGTNNALGKNSFELLSNQLSNWLSQISDEFDIGVNYRPGDQISSEEVEVALSTQLLNDRVVLETNVGVQGDNPGTNRDGSQIIGDFLLEYKISEDGSVRSKVFNRSNTYNPAYENQAPYTQGVGISYQEDFATWEHLICQIRRRFMTDEQKKKLDCDEYVRQKARLRKEKNKAEIDKD